ncbi:hypothetical protein [Streptomyces sp. NPDC005077]|uniref:hypothetical protein n=1 Tax=Streptomyces sp. NPDC005077 TaxID=3154292 RepID=UPI0033ABB036
MELPPANPEPGMPVARELVEHLFHKNYEPLVVFSARRTGHFETAAELAERVLVAAVRERVCRTPREWTTWCWATARRVYDDFFLESCGVQP